MTSVKTPPYHRASSPWAYMRIYTHNHRFQVSELKIQTFCSAPAPCFAQNQSDVNRCLLFRGETVFFCSDSRQPLNTWAQWSPYLPPCSLSGDEAGGAFIVSASTRRHLARLFLSLLRLMWRASTKAKTWKQKEKGRTCGLTSWSERPFFACEFVQFVFSCMFENCYIF